MKIQANAPVTKLVEPASLTITLTPTEAYHLFALLSCGVLCSSLNALGLEKLQKGLERQFYGSGPLAISSSSSWEPFDVGWNNQAPLDLHRECNPKVLHHLHKLEKVDA